MKTKESFISGAFILAIFVFVLIFVDFLALMDIHQDYVSQKVLELIQVDITDKLPDWASTSLEWNFIRLSLILKSIFMVIIIIALTKAVRK
ncbi:MAG: hypothetical protein KQI35_16145 [Bacteroidetes bacterium]|nr:hypothetical protein [Bacteroidota bacterium]